MHLFDPHRNPIGTYHMQRTNQSRLRKIKIILDLKPLVNPKQVRVLLGHIGYYRKFIRHYSDMFYPLEELLIEDQEYEWNEECDASLDTLNKKLVETPIHKFPS